MWLFNKTKYCVIKFETKDYFYGEYKNGKVKQPFSGDYEIVTFCKTENEAKTICELFNRVFYLQDKQLEQLETEINELKDKLSQMESEKTVSDCKLNDKLLTNDPYRAKMNCSSVLGINYGLLNIYVVTGEYPNYSIDKKEVITKDDFNYCLKEKETNNISLWPKNKCFKTYEEANNKVLELIQKETNKEHSCACKCTSKKK